jgi:hypothetical protein
MDENPYFSNGISSVIPAGRRLRVGLRHHRMPSLEMKMAKIFATFKMVDNIGA